MNRRDWLISTLSMATLPEILAAQEHAHHAVQSIQPPAFSYLDKKAAADIEALTGEIIPSGDSPGAREAGVVYFIDRALHTFDQAQQGLYRSGLDTRKRSGNHCSHALKAFRNSLPRNAWSCSVRSNARTFFSFFAITRSADS